jgi:hypothetical protein
MFLWFRVFVRWIFLLFLLKWDVSYCAHFNEGGNLSSLEINEWKAPGVSTLHNSLVAMDVEKIQGC